MLIEELTHIPTESLYEKLLGSCRSTVPGISPQVFATTNPDGPGYQWVKERWNIPDEPTELVFNTITTPAGGVRHLIFIPAKLEDNPALMTADPGYVSYLDSLKDPDLRKAWREGSWAGLSAPGAYYKVQMAEMRAEERITNVPYQAGIPVHTWWDLGVGDSTSIGFFQQVNKEWRLIDYHEASGEGIEYYIKVLHAKPYVYGRHYAPHDIEVREFSTGQSRKDTAQKLGIRFEIAPNLPIDDGINAVRRKLGQLWVDKTKCHEWVRAMNAYQKEFNDKLGEYKPKPLHDWSSHCADMTRYWAVTDLPDDKPRQNPAPQPVYGRRQTPTVIG
jgi:hypothetical protein